jgi:hypothetical protein
VDVTLGWTPEADITLLKVDDEVAGTQDCKRQVILCQHWGCS